MSSRKQAVKDLRRAVFMDFDGTITEEETFVQILKKFSPELSAKLIPEMYALKLTLRKGVRRILQSIPSTRYQEMLDFVADADIRPGFRELVNFLRRHRVPLIIVSGGLTEIIQTVLHDMLEKFHALHAAEIDHSGRKFKVSSEFEAGTELVSKVDVMNAYPTAFSIAVGDSVTDLNMAQQANLVFARDRLSQYLEEREIEYVPWEDFFEIRDYLEQLWSK